MFKLEFERSGTRRLEALQMLRAVAALLVVFSHVLRIEHEDWAGSASMYFGALPFGDLGVYAFFVISGFIMYFTAGDQFGVSGAVTDFLRKRLTRIVPMYWLFTGLTLLCPFAFGWHPASTEGLVLSLAFFPDVTNPPWFVPVLGVGWSLVFEMLFYGVFAACLALPRRLGLPILLSVFPALLAAVAALGHTAATAQPWWPIVLWYARQALLLFVLGVALAIVQGRVGRVVDRRGLGVWCAFALLILTPLTMLLLHLPEREKAMIGLAAIAATLCAMTTGRSWDRFRPLIRMGDASYALYLSHPLVIGALSAAWSATIGHRFPMAFAALALACTAGVAMVVHVAVEKPLVRAGQRLRLPAWA